MTTPTEGTHKLRWAREFLKKTGVASEGAKPKIDPVWEQWPGPQSEERRNG